MAIRILITDDHGVIRAGLRALLDGIPELEVVGEASDGLEVLRKVEKLKPDIVLMDLSMPNMGGIEATRQLSQVEPGVRVLILTVHEDDSRDSGGSQGRYVCSSIHDPRFVQPRFPRGISPQIKC